MADLMSSIVKMLAPEAVELARAEGGYEDRPFAGKRALLAGKGYATAALRTALEGAGASVTQGLPDPKDKLQIVVLDGTGLATPADYRQVYDSLHPVMRQIAKNGRVLIVAPVPAEAASPVAAAVARGLEGFSRSLGKELGKFGTTVNLAYVAKDATDRLDGIVRFFCGPQTAYVDGQAVTVTSSVAKPAALPTSAVLKGKVVVVTGAARSIGLATAQRLAQEGAQVVSVDIPAMNEELTKVCAGFGATPLALDIASADAPARLCAFLKDTFGGVDVIVHNAGITRDRTLANMQPHFWDMAIAVNFAAIVAIDEALLSQKILRDGGRIVCLSSISGVAGNFGQTNYGATKAALIGYVAALAPKLAGRGIAVNAVAPGFIETPMTDAMPFATREVGKRLNSLKQGGKPRDVAELITFFSSPGSYGITGNTVRVCGQQLIGA